MRRRNTCSGRGHRWGVILAGGDGTRLLSLTRSIHGDDRPKQFSAVMGGETLLEQTRRRIAPLIPAARTAYSLTRTHERFYAPQLASVPAANKFAQPSNRGTAHGILYSLLRLRQMDPDALVAFFPSDHHIANVRAFQQEMRVAFDEAEASPAHIVMLGIEAVAPEQSYGWIEPGPRMGRGFQVQRFCEKPDSVMAASLMRQGCLWNSFVMVGTLAAFLEPFAAALPDLFDAFVSVSASLGTESEDAAMEALYRATEPSNFSFDVLAAQPEKLIVMAAKNLGWSDLGEPARVQAARAELPVLELAWAQTA